MTAANEVKASKNAAERGAEMLDGWAAVNLNSRVINSHVELISADSIKPEPIAWLWPGWLARGKLHILAGSPGTGKTTIAMSIAAAASSGRPFPGGAKAPPGCVVIWSGEDDPADTLVPRLIAAGADLGRVRFVGAVRDEGGHRPFDPARDLPALAERIKDIGAVSLIVVDPIVSAVAGDSHKNAEVRRALAPMVDFASTIGAAIIGITHYSKGTSGRDPTERVTGSLAFGALARLVWGTGRREDQEHSGNPHYVLARAKSNIGPDGGGFLYALEQREIEGGVIASCVCWGGELEGSARDLLKEEEPCGPEGTDATDFLRQLLEEEHMTAKAIYREAEAAGFSRDAMKRAKAKIGAKANKEGMTGGWIWRLPSREEGAEGCEGSARNSSHPSRPSGTGPLPSANDLDYVEEVQ